MPIDLGFHFQNCKHFLEYSGFYLLTTVYMKKRYWEFLFIYFHSYNNKSKLFCKMLVLLFSSNIPLYIEKKKIPQKKIVKVLETKLKTYTPVTPKFVLEKIIFKVLHYIQHDFICQCLGLSKDQASIFKSFLLITLIADYKILLRTHSDGYIKR